MAAEPEQRTPAENPRLLSREFLLLLAAVSFFGFSWSFYLILPKFFATELGMDAAGIGRAVAVEGLTAVAITPLVGWLVDRYGRQPWLVFGNFMLALTGVMYLFVDHEGPLLYLAQMCWGVGMVMGFNAAGTMTADIAPSDRMAQALGLFGAANLGMNAVSPTLGEILADGTGWTSVFVASAAAGLLAALLSTRLSEPPRHPPQEHEPRRPIFGWPLSRVYAATFVMTASFTALFTLHQPFALELGVTELRSFFIGFALVALTVRLGGGRLIDRFGVLRSSIVAFCLYSAVPPMLGFLGPDASIRGWRHDGPRARHRLPGRDCPRDRTRRRILPGHGRFDHPRRVQRGTRIFCVCPGANRRGMELRGRVLDRGRGDFEWRPTC